MNKLACLVLIAAACGGNEATPAHDASVLPTDDAPTTMIDAGTDAGSGSGSDGGMQTADQAPARLVVSGAKRLTGAGGLVVDVEVGHSMDQGVRTAGSIVVRGGAASFGN